VHFRDYPTVPLNVISRSPQQDRIVLELAKARIAGTAQLISQPAGEVVMVGVGILAAYLAPADPARPVLPLPPFKVLGQRDVDVVKPSHVHAQVLVPAQLKIVGVSQAAPGVLGLLPLGAHIGAPLGVDVRGGLEEARPGVRDLVFPDRRERDSAFGIRARTGL
jgi:hypothetical protein